MFFSQQKVGLSSFQLFETLLLDLPERMCPPSAGSDRFLKFRPDDDTYPIVLVPQSEILQHLEWKELPNYLYRLRLERWDLRSQFPVGSFVMFLGKVVPLSLSPTELHPCGSHSSFHI